MPERPDEHERRDADVSRIVLAGVFLLAAIVLVLGIMSLFVPARPAPPVPTESTAPFTGGGRPALQISPARDLAALRAEEDKRLESYSWVDRGQGVVAIPIERAMKLLVERGVEASETRKER